MKLDDNTQNPNNRQLRGLELGEGRSQVREGLIHLLQLDGIFMLKKICYSYNVLHFRLPNAPQPAPGSRDSADRKPNLKRSDSRTSKIPGIWEMISMTSQMRFVSFLHSYSHSCLSINIRLNECCFCFIRFFSPNIEHYCQSDSEASTSILYGANRGQSFIVKW